MRRSRGAAGTGWWFEWRVVSCGAFQSLFSRAHRRTIGVFLTCFPGIADEAILSKEESLVKPAHSKGFRCANIFDRPPKAESLTRTFHSRTDDDKGNASRDGALRRPRRVQRRNTLSEAS